MSNVAAPLKAALLAVLATAGVGVGVVVVGGSDVFLESDYLQMIAEDAGTTPAVKAGMVLGAYYESSFAVRLVPYRDELSASRPWTVCNGVTSVGMPAGFPAIVPTKRYTLAECYRIERALYLGYDAALPAYVRGYAQHTFWQQATYMDFVHHFGIGAFAGSTMRKKANAGDAVGACEEHARWKYTTLPSGAKAVLTGLEVRANSNAEICRWPVPPQAAVIFLDGLEVLA